MNTTITSQKDPIHQAASLSFNKWFRRNGFNPIRFEDNKTYITTYYLDQIVSYKLVKNPGYESYYKESTGGSIIVFEIKECHSSIDLVTYSPIWLFGMKTIKLSFKKKASWPFKYLEEGHLTKECFIEFLKTKKKVIKLKS